MLVTIVKDYGDYKAGQHLTLIVPEAKLLINEGYAKPYQG